MEHIFCLIFCTRVQITTIHEIQTAPIKNQQNEISSVNETKQRPQVIRDTNKRTGDTTGNNSSVETGRTIYSYPSVTVTASNKPVIDAIPRYAGNETVQATELWRRESSLEPCKINGGAINCNYKGNKACGFVQFNPCGKLLAKCELTNVECQLREGTNYVKARYGNFTNALAYWDEHKWY